VAEALHGSHAIDAGKTTNLTMQIGKSALASMHHFEATRSRHGSHFCRFSYLQ
jgi:hypothetical protein